MRVTLAYFDSFAGLVPVRIVSVGEWTDPTSEATFQVTATRGAYKRGTFHTFSLNKLIPRHCVSMRGGQVWVSGYSWREHLRK